MKKSLAVSLLLFATASSAWAIENWTTTAPITRPSLQVFHLKSFSMDVDAQQITATVVENTTGDTFTCGESGQAATNIMSNINTRNFSGAVTFHQRLLNFVNNKCPGLLPTGTISGTPQ